MAHRWACVFGFKNGLKVISGALLGAAMALSCPALASQPVSPPASSPTEPLDSQLETQVDSNIIEQVTLSVGAQQAQLLDLGRFPLFLSDVQGVRVADSQSPSPVQISQPSLTWLQDQLNDRHRRDLYRRARYRRDRAYRELFKNNDRLVESWQAYFVSGSNGETLKYVDAIVSELAWGELNDFERYAVILQFGAETQRYGYHLRMFHSGDAANATDAMTSGNAGLVVLRGAYLCDFDQTIPDQTIQTPNESFSTGEACEILLNNAIRRNRPAQPIESGRGVP